ncbi:transcription elongation factor GreA [Desulfatibacillum alkenivorans DSM 16219]|uniref:Transcription elongation factor GreA n=1 Tax=Desulfatibacillum alkenivorans DSM 16219 TaxID=1121393 RepID=A0A1M7AM59_9BACT|nr:transcription elongation factor GreA [Desulfatibacillum alkenivorans]SHL43499.1 transcription elongation factor GreA [Desulfatibacillum alkenivorans DSM 16219]
MERTPITPEGLERLQNELVQLKTVERPKNIQDIEEARAHGDLSENAEYHAAKERQSFIAGRIAELEYKVASADVIDPSTQKGDTAVFGSTVVLENIDTGEEVSYQLLGPDESNIQAGKISVTSPLGKALVGKKPGDEVKVQTPGGQRHFEVVEIQ